MHKFIIDILYIVAIFILAAFVSILLKKHKEFITPAIFGLMYGNYVLWKIYTMK